MHGQPQQPIKSITLLIKMNTITTNTSQMYFTQEGIKTNFSENKWIKKREVKMREQWFKIKFRCEKLRGGCLVPAFRYVDQMQHGWFVHRQPWTGLSRIRWVFKTLYRVEVMGIILAIEAQLRNCSRLWIETDTRIVNLPLKLLQQMVQCNCIAITKDM